MNYLKQDNCLENLDIARILIDAKITGLVNDNKKNINTIRNTNIAFLHSKCDYKYNNLETSLIGFREIKRNEDIIVLTTIPCTWRMRVFSMVKVHTRLDAMSRFNVVNVVKS